MPTAALLFADGDLAIYVQAPVTSATETAMRRVASGWLYRATRLAEWPVPITDDLWAWGLELAAIAMRNPDGAASESVDDHSVSWDRQRRADILNEARAAYVTGSSQPQYDFPDPDWHWTAVPIVPLTVQ